MVEYVTRGSAGNLINNGISLCSCKIIIRYADILIYDNSESGKSCQFYNY